MPASMMRFTFGIDVERRRDLQFQSLAVEILGDGLAR